MARNIVIRTARTFNYLCNVADKTNYSFLQAEIAIPTKLKNPAKNISKYLPDNYVFISFVNETPTMKFTKYFMDTKKFMENAEIYNTDTFAE